MRRTINKFLVGLIVLSLVVSIGGISSLAAEVERTIEITVPVGRIGSTVIDLEKYGDSIRNVIDGVSADGKDLGDIGTPGDLLVYYMAANFEKVYPKVRVNPIYYSNWFWNPPTEVLLTAIAGGTAPAYYPERPLGGPQSAAAKGLAADITEYVKDWAAAEYLNDAIWGEAWYKGRCYAIPWYDGGTYPGIAYRKDWLEEAGIFNAKGEPAVEDDWTWDDFVKIAQKITNPKEGRWAIGVRQGKMAYGHYLGEGLCGALTKAFGAPQVIPDPTGKYTYKSGLNTAPSVQVFQFLNDLIWKYEVALTGIEVGVDEEINSFLGGRQWTTWYYGPSNLTRHSTAPWARVSQKQADGSIKKIPYTEILAVAPMPKGPEGIRISEYNRPGMVLINPTLSEEEKRAAFDWLNWWFVVQRNLVYQASADRSSNKSKTPLVRQEPFLTDPNVYPVAGIKPWLETMPPQYARIRELNLALPAEPKLLMYGFALENWGEYRSLVQSCMQESFASANADIEAVAKKYADIANKTVFNYQVEGVTNENWKEYYTDLDAFYKKNFPEYYNKVFKGLFEKYYKVW